MGEAPLRSPFILDVELEPSYELEGTQQRPLEVETELS